MACLPCNYSHCLLFKGDGVCPQQPAAWRGCHLLRHQSHVTPYIHSCLFFFLTPDAPLQRSVRIRPAAAKWQHVTHIKQTYFRKFCYLFLYVIRLAQNTVFHASCLLHGWVNSLFHLDTMRFIIFLLSLNFCACIFLPLTWLWTHTY